MSDEITNNKDVKSTSVSITFNAKQFGVDAFIKLEQTNEFVNLASEVDALVKREEIAQLLTEQVLNIIKDTAEKLKSVMPVATQTVSTFPNAGNIRAVANGAGQDGDWRVAVDAFDSAKQVRYLSLQALPSDDLKGLAKNWLSNQGFGQDSFDIWDERRDAEAGKPISSICNIKVKEEYRNQLPNDLMFTDKGGVKAVARAKFNSDGSVFFYWANKQVDAAVKYGAFSAIQ